MYHVSNEKKGPSLLERAIIPTSRSSSTTEDLANVEDTVDDSPSDDCHAYQSLADEHKLDLSLLTKCKMAYFTVSQPDKRIVKLSIVDENSEERQDR